MKFNTLVDEGRFTDFSEMIIKPLDLSWLESAEINLVSRSVKFSQICLWRINLEAI
ncbi:hypothetical protein [Pedobacter agri]|uniref:hypothetical protein n=1 Tax=Pedobacter agri TaxID=454586 RepID=UPI0029318A62|nr:hypothetical protein [Pedobacter agri]